MDDAMAAAGPLRRQTRLRQLQIVLAFWSVCVATLGFELSFSEFMPDLLEGLHGSRAGTAAIGSICTGMMDLPAILVGLLVARFGGQCTSAAGAVLASLGLLLASLGSRVEHLWLSIGLVAGLGFCLLLFTAIITVNQWFTTRLASAHALANTGSSVGPLVMGLGYRSLSDAYGWRGVFVRLAVIYAAVLLLCSLAFRSPPAQHKSAEKPPRSILELIRMRDLQIVSLSFAFFGIGGFGVFPFHLSELALDAGYTESDADHILVTYGLGVLLLRFPVAISSDLIQRKLSCGRRIVFSLCACFYAVMLILLTAVSSKAMLPSASFLVGGALGAMLSLMPALPMESVDPPDMPMATTLACSCFGVGAVLGPIVAGALFDARGAYRLALQLAASSLLASAGFLSMSIWLPRWKNFSIPRMQEA